MSTSRHELTPTLDQEGPSLSFDLLQDQVLSERPLRSLGAHRGLISTNLPPSPASSMTADDITKKEGHRSMQKINRGTPGDAAILRSKTPEEKALSKRRSQYYDEVFDPKDTKFSARDRVVRESIVLADVRTNVIIKDEYTFITDLSYNLSNRYQRPESSILVTLTHSACLLLGGSWDPAYILTITALPSQMQPVTNKRNAALIQQHLDDSIGVSADRGIIKFVPIAEENFATNGKTVSGEIDDLEREMGRKERPNLIDSSASQNDESSKTKKRQSQRSLKGFSKFRDSGRPLSTQVESYTPPASPEPPPIALEKPAVDAKSAKSRRMSRSRSFMSGLFGRGN